MIGRGMVAAVIAISLACANGRSDSVTVSTSSAKTLGSGETCPATPELPAASGEGSAGGVPAPKARPVIPVFQGKLLLPPSEPGKSVTEVTGCAAATGEAEATRAAATNPAPERGPARTSIRVNEVGGGILVAHELPHACCLKAELSTTVEGSRVVVFEKLKGEPCRCMCSSTLRTAIGLKPGSYTLQVDVEQPGQARQKVHEEPLTLGK